MRRILSRAKRYVRARLMRARFVAGDHGLLFAFTGGTGSWPEMGRSLYRTEPPFREAIDAAAAVVEEVLGWDAGARFRGVNEPEPPLEIERRNEIVHLGMLQLAQVDLWRAFGVQPHGVVSVSLGEMVAPYAAGAISRDDCARILAAVSHSISKTASDERMFIVRAEAERARRLVRLAPVPIDFIGSAAAGASVLICRSEHIEATRAFLGESLAREIATDWCYHTPRLEVDRAWLREQLRDVKTLPASCPIFSAAAGGMLPPGTQFDADFFAWMVSRAFLYAPAVEAALRHGYNTIVTLGPQPANNLWMAAIARAQGTEVRFVDTMRADLEEQTWAAARGALRGARIVAPQRKPIVARSVMMGDADTFEIYEALRPHGPVHWLPRHQYWLLIGYDEVRRALADPERFSSEMDDLRMIDPVILGNDSASHATARRIVSRYFTSDEVARRTELAAQTAERLLRPLREGRELDVVTEFAHPLVEAVVADLVGLDASELATRSESAAEAAGDVERLSALIAASDTRARMVGELLELGLEEAAAHSVTRLMWIAGSTPQHAIGPAVLLLLQHDDVRRRVQKDPTLLGAFVDESLRLHPPALTIPRVASTGIQIGGHTIRAGERMQLSLAAANRDPARFEDPASLRLDRGANPHVAFGGGLHHCIGAALGRGLMIAALQALFRVVPHFHAVQPLGTVRHASNTTLRELEQLVIGA